MPGSSQPPPGRAVAQLVWINGRAGGGVSALERGLHFGDGLFETVACMGGRARFLELHLQRLAAGCARLGLAAPDEAILRAEVQQLAAPSARAIIKVLLTRGAAASRGYALTGSEAPTRISLRYAWPPGCAMPGPRKIPSWRAKACAYASPPCASERTRRWRD